MFCVLRFVLYVLRFSVSSPFRYDGEGATTFKGTVQSREGGILTCKRKRHGVEDADLALTKNLRIQEVAPRPVDVVVVLVRGECFREGGHGSRRQHGSPSEQMGALASLFSVGAPT